MLEFTLPTSNQPSTAYFCPACGTLWARVVCGGKNWSNGEWSPVPQPCPEHHALDWYARRYADHFPGSLLWPFIVWDSLFMTQLKTALRTLPEEWLRYEFNLEMQHAEGRSKESV